MTTGQMMFYAGAALLGVTLLLAIVFAIKKPKYQPRNIAADGGKQPAGSNTVQQAAQPAGTTEFMAEAQPDSAAATEFMGDVPAAPTELMQAPETEYIRQ